MEYIVTAWNWLIGCYSPFFEAKHWEVLWTQPALWGVIGLLVVMEGLLSFDNAFVLATRVQHLPEAQRSKALKWGMVGAFVMRFIAIGLGTTLTQLWWAQVAGGLYLLWLVVKEMIDRSKTEDDNHDGIADVYQRGFWYSLVGTIVVVECMDFVFSIDSILASVAMSSEQVIILIGGVLGIIAMRFVAGIFSKLLDSVPELKSTAFVLIFIIGVKLVLGGLEIHVNEIMFYGLIILVFASTFVLNYINKRRAEEVA